MGVSAFQSVHKQLSGVCNLGKHEWLSNKVNFQLIYSFIFETRRKYFKYFKYFYNFLEKVENLLESFSSHALHGSHSKIKVSHNPTQWDSIAPSKNFTIIYILFGIKVFLSVTKHKPEAIEQQGELQNDGSLGLEAPRSFKRRKTRKLKFSSWKPLPKC